MRSFQSRLLLCKFTDSSFVDTDDLGSRLEQSVLGSEGMAPGKKHVKARTAKKCSSYGRVPDLGMQLRMQKKKTDRNTRLTEMVGLHWHTCLLKGQPCVVWGRCRPTR